MKMGRNGRHSRNERGKRSKIGSDLRRSLPKLPRHTRQEHMARYQRGISRLVSGDNIGSAEFKSGAALSRKSVVKSRGKNAPLGAAKRKLLRKQLREEKKRKRSAQPQSGEDGVDSLDPIHNEKDAGHIVSDNSKKDRRKNKRQKHLKVNYESDEDNGHISLLEEKHLFDDSIVHEDPEDAEIRHLEKLLNIKKGKKLPAAFKSEGLDFMLDYKDDLEDHEIEMIEAKHGLSQSFDSSKDLVSDASSESESSLDAISEPRSDSDVDSKDDFESKIEKSENTVYMGRDGMYGETAESPRTTAPAKYVPPHLRNKAGGDSTAVADARLKRMVFGSLNRVSGTNLSKVSLDLEGIFMTNSRSKITALVSEFLVETCVAADQNASALFSAYVACLTILNSTIGMEVGAAIVQDFVMKLDVMCSSKDSSTSGPENKKCSNLIMFLGFIYNFRIIHSNLIVDLLKKYSSELSALNVELILKLLQTCGTKLRTDDPASLKLIIDLIQGSAKKESNIVLPRMKFMIEAIADLKNNRKKIIKDIDISLIQICKRVVKKRGNELVEPLRASLNDLLDADQKGRWWIVGSAWQGNMDSPFEKGMQDQAQRVEVLAPSAESVESHKLLELASSQRMNTEIRRKIFCVIMGSQDYLDAFEKIIRLNLKDKKDRDVMRVLLDCTLQEKSYNPYYAHLGLKLCQHNHNHKVTLQYAIWDRFKILDTLLMPQIISLTKFMCHVVINFGLSLSLLKVVEFSRLSEKKIFFFQLFFVHLLTHFGEDAAMRPFERIGEIGALSKLRNAISVFLRLYVKYFEAGIGNGCLKNGPKNKKELLKSRVALAREVLSQKKVL
eukprot:UC4_evm1s134